MCKEYITRDHIKMQRHMFMLCSLVQLINIIAVEGKNNTVLAPGGNTPAPPAPATLAITYTCNKHVVTEITITHGNYSKARVMQQSGQYCIPDTPDQNGIKRCLPSDNPRKETMMIMYGNEEHPDIIGGDGIKYFSLSCEETSGYKIAEVAHSILQTTPSSPTKFTKAPLGIPSLSIKGNPLKINVGQAMTLQMTVTDTYKIQPEKCTAYRQKGDSRSYQFWKRCESVDPAIVPSSAVWTDNTNAGLELDMFAFKFVDDNNVFIECSTKVCPQGEAQQCAEKCPGQRHRRSNDNLLKLESKVKTQTAEIKLKVLDIHIGQHNGSQGLTSRWYITIIGIVVTCWISFQKLL